MQMVRKKLSLSILLLMVNVLLSLGTNVRQPDQNNRKGWAIIQRSEASKIKSYMLNQNPCDNFYEFACGGWPNLYPASSKHLHSTDKFQTMTDALEGKINKFLNEKKTGDNFGDNIKDFYKSCQNVKSQLPQYRLSLENVYKEYGQFSFQKPAKQKFNWLDTIAKIQRTYGKSIILALDVQRDVNGYNNMVYIGPPDFTLNRPKMHSKFPKYLNEHFDLAGDKTLQVATPIFNFEASLMAAAENTKSNKTMEQLLTRYDTNALIRKYKGELDLGHYLKVTLSTTTLPREVYLYDESYLENLIEVLAHHSPVVLQDYILSVLIEEYLLDIKSPKLEKLCVQKARTYFGKYLDGIIYTQIRSKEYENEISQLWDDIKNTFQEALSGNQYSWMSENTREEAKRKLQNMRLSTNIRSDNYLETFFFRLRLRSNTYVANIQNIRKTAEALRENKLNDIKYSQMLSSTITYNTFQNVIGIPVDVLLPFQLWALPYPKALKYATLGFLMAREMIHGFDDEGRYYDSKPLLRNWWDEKSIEEYNKRRNCFKDQYDQFSYFGKNLTTPESQTENIADNAAIKLAYTAYMKWLARAKSETKNIESSEGFVNLKDIDNKKLFFISFSQLFCADINAKVAQNIAKRDIYAPVMYRVIGSLSNFNTFSDVFGCAIGTFMNPRNKCELY